MSNENLNRSTRNLHCVGLVGITAIALVLEGFTPVNCVCLVAEATWIGLVESGVVDKRVFMNIKAAVRAPRFLGT